MSQPDGKPPQRADPSRRCQLADRFAGADRAAVADVAERIRRVVNARGHFVAGGDRGDVVQQAMIDVIHAVRTRNFGDEADFLRFLRTIAHRRCIDWLRQTLRRNRFLGIEASVGDGGGHQPLSREKRRLAAEVLSQLSPSCRRVIALKVGRSLSYSEMSRLLGRSIGALRSQFSACLGRARILLGRLRRASE